MLKFAAFVLAMLLSGGSVLARDDSVRLSPGARLHVDRVVASLAALRGEPASPEANARANRSFELLLSDQSASGDEALAALAGHYLGDSTEPECEILARGRRMLPLLELFSANPPEVGLPVSGVHARSGLIDQIVSGKSCG